MLKILGIAESIIYVLSNIFLIISFLKLKKSNEKLNLIHWIVISLLLLFCYNSLIALVLSTFNIPIYLIFISIINVIISLIFIKSKEKQEHFILKKDIFATLSFIALTLIITVVRFGLPLTISYETCDPGIHFWTSKEFYEQSFLLNKVTDKTVVNFETRQTASYTNVGLLFKTVGPFTDSFNLYKFYILYDLYMFFMAAMVFYILISNTKTKGKYLMSIVLTLIYILGYPLNNMLFGFFYSGHAITLICLLLMLMKCYNDDKFNNKIEHYILGLLCFGLFFTYYFFAPVVFIALFIYMTYKDYKAGKKIISKEFITKNLIIFFGACLLGFLYYIVPNLGDKETSIATQINLNGYYYNNIFSNFVLLIPIIFLSYISMRKNKDLRLEHIMLVMLLVFMSIILYFMFQESAAGYYLSKNYYLLWLITFTIFCNFMVENYDNYRKQVISYIFFIILIIMSTVTEFEQKVIDLEEWKTNFTIASSNIFYVYRWNYETIFYEEPDFNASELEMLHEIYKMGATDIQNNASHNLIDRRAWFAAWFRKKPITDTTENKLFTFLMGDDYVEIMPELDQIQNNQDIDYFYNINTSGSKWFLLFYKKLKNGRGIEYRDKNVIQGKENYDKIDRSECKTCTFYEFDDGLLIYKKGGMFIND